MVGMVPLARHNAVNIPIKIKVINMFFAFFTLRNIIFIRCCNGHFLIIPKAKNMQNPINMAKTMEISKMIQETNTVQNAKSVMISNSFSGVFGYSLFCL